MASPRGDRITLAQIADVRDTFEEGGTFCRGFNGEPAAILEVLKTPSQDTLTIDRKTAPVRPRRFSRLCRRGRARSHLGAAPRSCCGTGSICLTRNGFMGLVLVFSAALAGPGTPGSVSGPAWGVPTTLLGRVSW